MTKRMNRTDLVRTLADETGVTRAAVDHVLDALVRTINTHTMDGGAVSLRGFGTFEMRSRAGHNGRNPKTGEAVRIGPSRRLGFRAATSTAV